MSAAPIDNSVQKMDTAGRSAVEARAAFGRLRMSHRRILTLHLKGHTAEKIAQTLQMSEGAVRHVLRRDDAKRVLSSAYAERIHHLLPRAVETVDKHMDSSDGQVALRAADIALRLNGKFEQAADSAITAEDVIERIMERISPDGTTTRLTERRRFRIPQNVTESASFNDEAPDPTS